MKTNKKFEAAKKKLLQQAKDHKTQMPWNTLGVRWVSGPPDASCPMCKKIGTLEKSNHLLGGPYSGSVRCTNSECGYQDSFYAYLGKTIIIVEPMPEGTTEIYDNETNK